MIKIVNCSLFRFKSVLEIFLLMHFQYTFTEWEDSGNSQEKSNT